MISVFDFGGRTRGAGDASNREGGYRVLLLEMDHTACNISSADHYLQEIIEVEWLCGEKSHPVPAVKIFSRRTRFAH